MDNFRFPLLGALLFISVQAAAFEVEGFRSGMSKAAVLEKASSWAKVSERDRDTVLASDSLGNYLSFNFCKDKLVSMQQGYKPSLRQYAIIVDDLGRNYGQPFSVASNSRAHPDGQIHELGIWWKHGEEFVSVYYMNNPHGESLSISHQSPNDCFKVPR
jgi:hypothetical protein